jgi:hypothetical protein
MRCVLFFLFVLNLEPALAQKRDPDRLYAHTDKSFYVTGEILNFKIYIFNENESLSELVHADFVSATGEIIREELLKIENNTASGSFEIPLTLKNGTYLFRIYSAWNSNFREDFNFYKSVPVFNDFDNLTSPVSSIPENNLSCDSAGPDQNYHKTTLLNLDPIHTRDSVYLEFELMNVRQGEGVPNLSIAVLDLGLCGLQDLEFIHTWYKKLNIDPTLKNELLYEPEKLIHIEGTIWDPDTRLPISSRVLSIYDIEQSKFTRLISVEGKFSFDMPLFKGIRSLQIINMNPYQSPVSRIHIKKISESLPTKADEAQNTDMNQINHYIHYSGLRRKIQELYRTSDIDTSRYHESHYLPFKPDRSYQMEKYQLLKNVEDFLREAVINTSNIKENDQRKILLNNGETRKFFMKPPWMMVDGYFNFNDSLVYNIPFNQLDRIDIYNTNQSILKNFDPIMIQGGIITVYTKNNYLIDYFRSQPNNLMIQGLAQSLNNENNPVDPTPYSPDTPEFNPVIYWVPSIELDTSNRAQIKFRANDVSGKYLIHIEGADASGRPFSAQRLIEVHP